MGSLFKTRQALKDFIFVGIVFAFYLYLSFSTPQSTSTSSYNFSAGTRAFLILSFSLPIFISFFLFIRSYRSSALFLPQASETSEIKNRFWRGLHAISVGFLLLTVVLMVGVMISQVRQRFYPVEVEPLVYQWLTILLNWIYSVGYLAVFYLIFRGSNGIVSDGSAEKKWSALLSVIVVGLVSAMYGLLVFTNPDRTSTVPGQAASFYLNDWLILLTIVLPSAVGWFLGILATFNLTDHRILAISRNGSRHLFYSLFLIITSAVLLQLILSVGLTRFLQLGITAILILIYVFVFVLMVGAIMFISGISKFRISE